MSHTKDEEKKPKLNEPKPITNPVEPDSPSTEELSTDDGGPNPPQPPPGKGGH